VDDDGKFIEGNSTLSVIPNVLPGMKVEETVCPGIDDVKTLELEIRGGNELLIVTGIEAASGQTGLHSF
jgi:hypothetical protein